MRSITFTYLRLGTMLFFLLMGPRTQTYSQTTNVPNSEQLTDKSYEPLIGAVLHIKNELIGIPPQMLNKAILEAKNMRKLRPI